MTPTPATSDRTEQTIEERIRHEANVRLCERLQDALDRLKENLLPAPKPKPICTADGHSTEDEAWSYSPPAAAQPQAFDMELRALREKFPESFSVSFVNNFDGDWSVVVHRHAKDAVTGWHPSVAAAVKKLVPDWPDSPAAEGKKKLKGTERDIGDGMGPVMEYEQEASEQLQTVHRHVKESLGLLGVDVSAEGYIPDSWTLREQCKIAGDKLRASRPIPDERIEQVANLREALTDDELDGFENNYQFQSSAEALFICKAAEELRESRKQIASHSQQVERLKWDHESIVRFQRTYCMHLTDDWNAATLARDNLQTENADLRQQLTARDHALTDLTKRFNELHVKVAEYERRLGINQPEKTHD